MVIARSSSVNGPTVLDSWCNTFSLNREQYAIICFNFNNDKNLKNNSFSSLTRVWNIFVVVDLCSSSRLPSRMTLLSRDGQFFVFSHFGPFHQRRQLFNCSRFIPLDIISAGFPFESTWCHSIWLVSFWISVILFATNGSHLDHSSFIHASVIVESLHKCVDVGLIIKTLVTC